MNKPYLQHTIPTNTISNTKQNQQGHSTFITSPNSTFQNTPTTSNPANNNNTLISSMTSLCIPSSSNIGFHSMVNRPTFAGMSNSTSSSMSATTDECNKNQHLNNILSNLNNIHPDLQTSILHNINLNNNIVSLSMQKSCTNNQYPQNQTQIAQSNRSHIGHPTIIQHEEHLQHGIQKESVHQNMLYIPSSQAQDNQIKKTFDALNWTCMESQNVTSTSLLKPLSPSSFCLDLVSGLVDECAPNEAEKLLNNSCTKGSSSKQFSSFSMDDITLSDIFQSSSTTSYQTVMTPSSQNSQSLFMNSFGSCINEELTPTNQTTSNLITPLDYLNSNLMQKQLIFDYYSSLMQARFHQVFGNVIQDESPNHPILTTQQFVYLDNPLLDKHFGKPLNLKLDLSEDDIEEMKSLFEKRYKRTGKWRKNSVTSSGSGSIGKHLSKQNKTKSSPPRKGRKCQAIPNNFSPLNEESSNWRFFSYNGDDRDPFTNDEEESQPSKLVFFKFNPVK